MVEVHEKTNQRHRRIYPDYVPCVVRGDGCMIAVGVFIAIFLIMLSLCYKKKSKRDDDEQERILKEELNEKRK